MKKIILYIITITLIMLFPITSKALTKVNLREDGNGKLNTTLHFEEGFIGGIDLKLKVKGNVAVKNVSFSSKIKENSFTTNYEYDAKSKTLRIIIVTGGIGSNHNLLNSKKELALGTITLNTSSKENEKYSFSIDSLKVLENNFNAKDIENITLDDNKGFTYIVKKEESKPEEDKKDDESKKKDESKTENTSQNDDNKQNDNETTSTNENNNVDNSTNNNSTNNNKNDKNVGNTSDDEDKDNNVIDNNTSEESNNDINDEVNNSNNLVYWSLAFSLLAIFIVILAVVLVKRKHKAGI